MEMNKSVPTDVQAVWLSVRESLRGEIGPYLFETWITPLTLERWTKNEVQLAAPKAFQRDWVATHYLAQLERAFRANGFAPPSLAIIRAEQRIAIGTNVAREPEPPPPQASISYLNNEGGKNIWNKVLHPAQTFESFIPEIGRASCRERV